jgi:uncharacterized protein DUF2154
MKRNLTIALTVLVLASLACNSLVKTPFSNVKTGPTETFSIDEPVPASAIITDASLVMAPSSATLALAGGAKSLVEGEIVYNVAEWKPTLTASDGVLRIVQELQDDKLHSVSVAAVDAWDLKLDNGVVNVRVDCPAGDFTLDFADTLPDGVTITIAMGAGNLRLVVPDKVAADIKVTRGPSNVSTEGGWTKDGSSYTNGGSGSGWTINIDMGVGNLTLVSSN